MTSGAQFSTRAERVSWLMARHHRWEFIGDPKNTDSLVILKRLGREAQQSGLYSPKSNTSDIAASLLTHMALARAMITNKRPIMHVWRDGRCLNCGEIYVYRPEPSRCSGLKRSV